MRNDASSRPDRPTEERRDAGFHGTEAESVTVIGASSPLGRRVVDLVASDPAVSRVVAVDLGRPESASVDTPPVLALEHGRTTTVERVMLGPSDALDGLFRGAAAVVHLGWAAAGGDLDPASAGQIVPAGTRVLAAADRAGATRLVLVSSATVYGAWTTNPVPLTEDAVLKPNPGFEAAVALAELERVVAEWTDDHPSARVAVARPVTTVAPDNPGWLARALRSALGFPVEDHDPPTQFLHLDDLASAVDVCRRAGLKGPVNVAPDGWLDGPDRRALDVRPRVRLPERVAGRVHGWRWRLGVAPTPPSLLPYAVHPWVVANDKLRAAGWTPGFTNEEAWVAGHPAGPLATLSPRRRQELILGAAGAALAGGGAVAVAAIRRNRR